MFASDSLNSDKEVVFAAVQKQPCGAQIPRRLATYGQTDRRRVRHLLSAQSQANNVAHGTQDVFPDETQGELSVSLC